MQDRHLLTDFYCRLPGHVLGHDKPRNGHSHQGERHPQQEFLGCLTYPEQCHGDEEKQSCRGEILRGDEQAHHDECAEGYLHSHAVCLARITVAHGQQEGHETYRGEFGKLTRLDGTSEDAYPAFCPIDFLTEQEGIDEHAYGNEYQESTDGFEELARHQVREPCYDQSSDDHDAMVEYRCPVIAILITVTAGGAIYLDE